MRNLPNLSDGKNQGLGRGSTSNISAVSDFKRRSVNLLLRVFRVPGVGNMRHAIRRHRHWLRRVGELALRRRQRQNWFGTIAAVALAAATLLEALAWRQLLHMRARNADDARHKVLYLMAVSIGQGVTFTARDINLINATLLGFGMELAALLGRPERRQ